MLIYFVYAYFKHVPCCSRKRTPRRCPGPTPHVLSEMMTLTSLDVDNNRPSCEWSRDAHRGCDTSIVQTVFS